MSRRERERVRERRRGSWGRTTKRALARIETNRHFLERAALRALATAPAVVAVDVVAAAHERWIDVQTGKEDVAVLRRQLAAVLARGLVGAGESRGG
jgi:hypothetical protein